MKNSKINITLKYKSKLCLIGITMRVVIGYYLHVPIGFGKTIPAVYTA